MDEKKFLKKFIILSAVLLILIAAVTVFFDPFYHYHKNLSFLKAVCEERDYEVTGTIDHFDYDAILLGDSTAENYNNAWLDDAFDARFVKGIRASGNVADLSFFLNRALEKHDLKCVVWSLGIGMMTADDMITFGDHKDYFYLVNRTPFDDTKYLFNKDVLLKKIPIQIAYSYFLDYDEGESYNWYSTKTFSKEAMMSHYYPQDTFDSEVDFTREYDALKRNLKTIATDIENNPNTQFYFYFAPYSALWWDCEYRMGRIWGDINIMKFTYDELVKYPNVHISDFTSVCHIGENLDLYMDTVHFCPEINYKMAYDMAGDTSPLGDDYEWKLQLTKEWVEEFSTHGILEYYEDASVE